MKISFVILFLLLLSVIIQFTKLKAWFPIKGIIIFGLFAFFCLLRFWEIHKENKKRHLLVDEIHGGY